MKRHDNRRGFTLAELLVVVAIIGALVAIAVPMLNVKMQKTRQAADLASVRNAYSAATTEWMLSSHFGEEIVYYYNGSTGRIQTTSDGISGYGKSKREASVFCTGFAFDVVGVPCPGGRASYLTIKMNENGVERMTWGDMVITTSPEQFNATTQEERLQNDVTLVNNLQNTLRNMTYREIAEMFGTKNSHTDQVLKVETGWNHTCYTLATSCINVDGEVVTSVNNIYATQLFSAAGYDIELLNNQQYIITSWTDWTDPNNASKDPLYIKVDIWKDLSKIPEGDAAWDQKATNAKIYLNGAGIGTRTNPYFGHDRS